MRVLALHGLGGGPGSFDPVRARLPAATCWLAPALLGHQLAGAPRDQARGGGPVPEGAGFAAEVDRLSALARAESGGPWHLCGYSLGARIGLALLLARPALFGSATLLSARAGLSGQAARAQRRAEDARWARLLRGEGTAAFAAAWEAQPLFATRAALAPELRAPGEAIRRAHLAEGLATALEQLGLGTMPDLGAALSGVTVPVHLLAGERDAAFHAHGERLRAGLPRARLTIVPHVGHDLLVEAPGAVASALMETSAAKR